ncbi:hypothetical protein [Aneurinibacillus danicus]|jgi:hypothetical protein|uniref:Uncharacterized protein n=1 Tax=Aneurinibacillus danicus TaxID=267746 RepID=A0A511VBL9_9BACL|nr:hypothetical protein [Aneurinibacillus danicus]GEN34632.1 hypothetical protein ADA01nite_20920 [Aneurinibacillus danicus]
MLSFKPGNILFEGSVGEWKATWSFGGFINDNTITIIYTAHRSEIALGRGLTSFSSNYFYHIEVGTEIQLPQTERKTYVAKFIPEENTIYLQKDPVK